MSFQEFTMSNGFTEVMVDICTVTGKIIDIYTYSNDTIKVYKESIDDFSDISISWISGKNPLFKHCPATQRKYAMRAMLLNEFSICLNTEDLEEEEIEAGILHKMLARYSMPSECEQSFASSL